MKQVSFLLFLFFVYTSAFSQDFNWTADGLAYYEFDAGALTKIDPKTGTQTTVIKKEILIPAGATKPLDVQSFAYSADNKNVLLFANTVKVWRYNTKGDYWILNTTTNSLTQLGKTLPKQSLMFAKFSPNGSLVAYVSQQNIYVEDVKTGVIKKLTTDGNRKLINGTFDWVYEEEFNCRDGFRWSPDSKKIAFWKIDASQIRDYLMVNFTDSVYSRITPVEYPTVGEDPSAATIHVVNVTTGSIKKMNIDGDPKKNFLTRLEWSTGDELAIQQLDRKQQESKLIYANINTGACNTFWAENDDAWVDLNTDKPIGWNWINNKKDFLWISEKDGWRHIYKISKDGKTTTLLTKGNYDIKDMKAIDEKNNYVYFSASPKNATQLHLFRVKINGSVSNEPEQISSPSLEGVHEYDISPNGLIASHDFSNYNTFPANEWVSLPDNKLLNANNSIEKNKKTDSKKNVEYVQLAIEDGVVLDAWINKPDNFDATKKYPVVLYVYGEPATTTVSNRYGAHTNFLYYGNIAKDGYVQISIDNRGTPALKGAKWRKAIYRNIGILNIKDLAMGTKKLLETYSYMDKSRVAVWGWSGGGSSTLNLMFKYPEIYKTGIAIAAVANQLTYDNIYQERYMGIPQETKADYIAGSPISNVKGLQGKLLYIHGTGDDNVHYNNAEMLLNEVIKYNKQIEFFAYPNRTHGISEGAGTSLHLATMYTNFLRKNCEPGAK
jgi:dipeptidyl-peptidase 4